jgi:hypothetical protein
MKGDFSRRTFDATKHYSAVLVEQGRMLTDADSEEEHRILGYREERATRDIVGPCGGPLPNAGFGLTSPDNVELRIGAGPYYAAGTLLENESETVYPDQPDRVEVPWPLPAGRHAIVLETWRRLITALDDPSIREVALGGPTTSSRERVVWQVGALPVAADWICTDELPDATSTTGELAARAEPDDVLTSPCLVPPQAGYTGLENQFYRVEIFESGAAYDLQAAADTVDVTAFPAGAPNQVTVSALGPLAVGDAVEIFRTTADPDPLAATFGYITAVDGTTLTLTTSVPALTPAEAPKLRRVDAAFVVSRDNGSVVTTIEAIDGVEITVHDTGPDDVLGFAIGQLVEISDDRIELDGARRRLHQIADIDQARRVIILRTPADALDADPSGVNPTRHAKLRRWDGAGGVRFQPDGKGWIHLEAGNQVRFTDGRYRSGDYWTFPARAATVDEASGTIEWPDDSGTPALQFPFGIVRHRCVLGYVDIDDQGGITDLVDCRNLFPPLTSLRNLLYVGGDGQEGSPSDTVGGFIPLPGPLEVRVANGGFPVEGAAVRFAIEPPGAGRLDGGAATVDQVTDANGLASCAWEIDGAEPHQICSATLLGPSGDPIAHQVVHFNATIDPDESGKAGCCLSIGPGGDYPTLDEALEDLIKRGERDICLCLRPGDHPFAGGRFALSLEKQPTHLSIRGCGRGARLQIQKRWELEGWLAVRLVDLDVFFARDASVRLLDVTDVEVRNCQIFGMRPDGALVGIYGFDRLQLTGSVLVGRRRGAFLVPAEFFKGLDPLAAPWGEENEGPLRELIVKVAVEIADLSAAARRALLKELTTRIGQAPDDLSRGEVEALQRLADTISDNLGPAPLMRALDLVARAAAVARPGVTLEIGAGRGDKQVDSASRVSVVIADNLIPGVMAFYGRRAVDAVLDEQTLKLLDALVTDNARILGTAGDVHIRDNRLGRVALSIDMIDVLAALTQNPEPMKAAYESFHLTDNVIDGAVSEILSRQTTMTSNDFTLNALPINQPPPNGVVANVIADTATYTGNHGQVPVAGAAPVVIRDITRTSAEAANLELQIL